MKVSVFMRGSLWQVAVVAALAGLASVQLSAQMLINGAGATFPAPIYQKWFSDFNSVDSNVQINYQAIGSGGGIRQVTEGTVDFGASDGPMTDQQLKEYQQKHGFPVLHFPTVLGAAVPAYNVRGVSASLNFTPEALAGIYLGKIKRWNDPAIQKANPKVTLPAAEIVVIHRSDGSGTTYCWTDYLSKISPEWKGKVGRNTSVNWPVGLGGKGNDGVAGLVKQTAGAIGYVELIYAVRNHMAYGLVRNSAGEFIKANLSSVSAAAAGAAANMPPDFRVSITNAPGKQSYPISTFTWLLIPSKINDAGKRGAIKKFLKWALTDGQKEASSLEYAPLPQTVRSRELGDISKIH
ncbi:MAG TPA: phosphate ABC transporter substrate-binding protein PstS [Bryobacteraceae bacterium]|nr:phosphate ABC transporter substrate-binding protein PstS [Bryobacteraceae bacterium]